VAESVEDQARVVRGEEDLADVAARRAEDEAVFDQPDRTAAEVEPAEPQPVPPTRKAETDDWTDVPTADEIAEAVARARRALVAMNRRQEHEEHRIRDESRAVAVARWHAEREAVRDAPLAVEAPALEYAGG